MKTLHNFRIASIIMLIGAGTVHFLLTISYLLSTGPKGTLGGKLMQIPLDFLFTHETITEASTNAFFSLTRLTVFVAWGLSGVTAYKNGKKDWAIVLCVIALLYIPFTSLAIRMQHPHWTPIIVTTLIVLRKALREQPWGDKEI